MNLSKFGSKFTRPNGISQLMTDLGNAKNSKNPDIIMLGGGNPAVIPEVNSVFVSELQKLKDMPLVGDVRGGADHGKPPRLFRENAVSGVPLFHGGHRHAGVDGRGLVLARKEGV